MWLHRTSLTCALFCIPTPCWKIFCLTFTLLAHQPACRWSSRKVSRENLSCRRLRYNCTCFEERYVTSPTVWTSDLQPFSCLCLLHAGVTALHAPSCPVYIILNINFLSDIFENYLRYSAGMLSCMLDIHCHLFFLSLYYYLIPFGGLEAPWWQELSLLLAHVSHL